MGLLLSIKQGILICKENVLSYRILEASRKLGVPVSTLRYWEKEFSRVIKPKRTNGGQRRYSDKDVVTFEMIKEILYGKKKSIDHAKRIIDGRDLESEKINWKKQSILLTGGTGSFGRHFCKVMLEKYQPRVIRVYSRDEQKHNEMRQKFGDERLRYFLGDVRDVDRLRRAMEGVDLVVHAAALKQVPVCEYNPFEAVKTNILGAQNVIDSAIDVGVKKVISLSTDKSVNPVNLYGATKLCAEKIFTQGNAYSGGRKPRFGSVRYGNVLGSRGSVVPLFIKQLKQKRITITDERMTRFWITLDRAVELVVKAFEHLQGGEVFVPKIPSMKVMDLAKIIAPKCKIEVIGIRPGEKIHEMLITEEDGRNAVEYNDMYIVLPQYSWWGTNNYEDGNQVGEGFTYTSNGNKDWMTVEDLKESVADLLTTLKDEWQTSHNTLRPPLDRRRGRSDRCASVAL